MSESTVTFRLKDINTHLVCRLCNGYFRDAHTITECLHTFCKSCLFLEIAKGLTVCPHCKIDLSPHPRNRILYDRTLQAIVDKIFPELEEQDRTQEEEFYTARGIKRKPEPEIDSRPLKLAAVSPTRHIPQEEDDNNSQNQEEEEEQEEGEEDDEDQQQEHSQGEEDQEDEENEEENEEEEADEEEQQPQTQTRHKPRHQSRSRSNHSSPKKNAHVPPSVNFDFKMVPDETAVEHKRLEPLPKPYLRTKPAIRAVKVKRYLGKKLGINPAVIDFSCQGQVVDNDMTLEQVASEFWHQAGPIVLHYRRV